MSIFITNGVHLYYEVSGEGIPLLFIHPPLLTGTNFAYQQKNLADRCRIITVDLPGHGRSSISPEPFTYDMVASILVNLLSHLCIDQAVVVGYSTGAEIACHMMITYPDRIKAGVLLSGMPNTKDSALQRNIKMAVFMAKRGSFLALATSICFSNANNPVTFALLLREALKGDPDTIASYYAYSLQYDCSHQLHRIKQPVLLLVGETDKRYARFGKYMSHVLPNSWIRSIPRVAHQLPTKTYQEVNLLLQQFLHTVSLLP
ncbi:alpha/beta fold hydrolase [Brevibacillus daliensis]|uniref:alpha/beta fold hydrolase n=1 Tax=Brevibacillus daliensis TaxID=2892995 RepID=UPI001E4BB2D7|nr:alpha/beta hydrolase [Brevibacillus daliensis]